VASGRLRFVDVQTLMFYPKTHGADGDCQLLLSPHGLPEALATLVPPPRICSGRSVTPPTTYSMASAWAATIWSKLQIDTDHPPRAATRNTHRAAAPPGPGSCRRDSAVVAQMPLTSKTCRVGMMSWLLPSHHCESRTG